MYHSGRVRFHDDLIPLMQDIDSVQQHPDNYNNGSVDEIVESIMVNGMYRPIMVQRSTGYILMGNHTWEACKELDARSIPVIYLDYDGDFAAFRAMASDNVIARLAQPDDAGLLRLLEAVQEAEGALYGTGVKDEGLEKLRQLEQRRAHTPLNPEGGLGGRTEHKHTCPSCGHTWATSDLED